VNRRKKEEEKVT